MRPVPQRTAGPDANTRREPCSDRPSFLRRLNVATALLGMASPPSTPHGNRAPSLRSSALICAPCAAPPPDRLPRAPDDATPSPPPAPIPAHSAPPAVRLHPQPMSARYYPSQADTAPGHRHGNRVARSSPSMPSVPSVRFLLWALQAFHTYCAEVIPQSFPHFEPNSGKPERPTANIMQDKSWILQCS